METIMYFFMIFLSTQQPVDNQKDYSNELSNYNYEVSYDAQGRVGKITFKAKEGATLAR